MEFGWSALVLLLMASAVIWFVQDSLATRERANGAAMEACQRLSLQFLDGTVAFARLAFTRERGQLALRRTYVFDYTANSIERRQGFVILVGRRVESVGYAPGEERRAQPQPPPMTISMSATIAPRPEPELPPPTKDVRPAKEVRPTEGVRPTEAAPPADSAQVFDLADWRARRRGTEPQSSQRHTGGSEPGNGHVDGQDHHQ